MRTASIADIDRAIARLNEAKKIMEKLADEDLEEYLVEEGLICEGTVEKAKFVRDLEEGR